MSSPSSPRVVGVLVGDVQREPDASVKYGLLFETLGRHIPVAGVVDANLRGWERAFTALRTFRPQRRRWRERFYKHPEGFRRRSRRAATQIRALDSSPDVILQVGVLFDALWDDGTLPSVIYTDYTARLSARSRFPEFLSLSSRQLARWLELEERAYRRAAHICTRSELVRASLLEDYGMPPDRVSAVGGGVNFRCLPENHSQRSGGPPTALFIGQDFHRKGGDLLLHAFAMARAGVPDARLLMVCNDAIPTALPLDGITIIRGNMSRTKISELYRAADLFVLPSRLETWGDVLLEAMAHGLPCIGVRGEAMEEIVVDGETGLLVPPEDPRALAAALSRLLLAPEQCRLLGLAARKRVEAELTWDQVVKRLTARLRAAVS